MVESGVVFPSAARTATHTSARVNNQEGSGLLLFINCTAIVSSPSVVFTLEGYDPASKGWYTILVSAAITGTGRTTLRVHPQLTAAANQTAKDVMPEAFRVVATHANANSITYSVGYALVP